VGAGGCAVGADSRVTRGCTGSNKKKHGRRSSRGTARRLTGEARVVEEEGLAGGRRIRRRYGERGCGSGGWLYTSGRGGRRSGGLKSGPVRVGYQKRARQGFEGTKAA
jgi:hypothetical protein